MNSYRIIFISLLFVLVSCGKDALSDSIIGTWNLKSVSAVGCDDPDDNRSTTELDENNCFQILPFTDFLCNASFTFNADGTGMYRATTDGEVETDAISHIVNDDTNVAELCEEDGEGCVELVFDGDTFSYMFEDDGCDVTVTYEKN